MNVSDPATARFAALLERHGADPAHWPEDDRAWALAYRADHLDADAVMLRDAAALDAALAYPVPPPPPALRIGILAAVAAEPRQLPHVTPNTRWFDGLAALWRDLGGARLAGPALAMALAAGVGLGWLLEPPMASAAEPDDLLALAQFDDHYTELSP